MIYSDHVLTFDEFYDYVRIFDTPHDTMSDEYELHFDNDGRRYWVSYYLNSQRYVIVEDSITRHINNIDMPTLYKHATENTEAHPVIQIYYVTNDIITFRGIIDIQARDLDDNVLSECLDKFRKKDRVQTDLNIKDEYGLIFRAENTPIWCMRLEDGWFKGTKDELIDFIKKQYEKEKAQF